MKTKNSTTLPLRNLMNHSPLQIAFLLIPLVLACFGLWPTVQAQICMEGCDSANENTFLGDDALINNTTGSANTGIGFRALLSNTTGSFNTANGEFALANDNTSVDNTANGH